MLKNKYSPIAFCKTVLICVSSDRLTELSFPIIVGYKSTDFLSLYTNLYYDGEWRYDSTIYEDMYRRNYFMKQKYFPEKIDYDYIQRNQSLIWKPILE